MAVTIWRLRAHLVIRTRRPFLRSRPSDLLLWLTLLLAVLTAAIPYLPFADLAGFVPLPEALVATLLLVTILYAAAAEATKRWFYRASG